MLPASRRKTVAREWFLGGKRTGNEAISRGAIWAGALAQKLGGAEPRTVYYSGTRSVCGRRLAKRAQLSPSIVPTPPTPTQKSNGR